jgi:O-antigen/teichoic acid export membrane protein
MVLFPVILIIVAFAHEGLGLWLGIKFADESSLILQFLALGVLVNSLAYIPFTFLEGIGRPDITAKIQLAELPVYFVLMWIVIKQYGINGAALVWFLRMIFDALILLYFAKKKLFVDTNWTFKANQFLILLFVIASFSILLFEAVALKLVFLLIILSLFIFIVWKYLLAQDEKYFLMARIKK